jgi:hypothetical protein
VSAGDENIIANLTASGVKDVKLQKNKWGNYPVLALTGMAKGNSPMFTAFLGINSPDTWVIAITYKVPSGKGHPTDEEKKVWERFLNETKPL